MMTEKTNVLFNFMFNDVCIMATGEPKYLQLVAQNNYQAISTGSVLEQLVTVKDKKYIVSAIIIYPFSKGSFSEEDLLEGEAFSYSVSINIHLEEKQ